MSSHPIYPLNPSESSLRKITDKINELIRHDSLEPWKYYDFSTLVIGQAWTTVINEDLAVPVPAKVLVQPEVTGDANASAGFDIRILVYENGVLIHNVRVDFDTLVGSQLTYTFMMELPIFWPYISQDNKRVPAYYNVRVQCWDRVASAFTAQRGNATFWFRPHYGQKIVPDHSPFA